MFRINEQIHCHPSCCRSGSRANHRNGFSRDTVGPVGFIAAGMSVRPAPSALSPLPPRRPARAGDAGWWQRLTAPWRLWPDFLVLGAQRGGTTSLFRYLEQHPDVVASTRKELHYFDYQFGRGQNWYRGHFPLAAQRDAHLRAGRSLLLTGEATPYYLACPQAPRRAAATVPRARLVALLRNPVDRAWSHYRMARWQKKEILSFEDAIAAEPDRLAGEYEKLCSDDTYYSAAYHQQSYLTRGLYLRQIQDWLRHYPREQFLLLRSEDFYRDPAAVYTRLCEFLGLPAWRPTEFKRFNEQSEKPMLAATRQRLLAHFHGPNAQLANFLGQDLDWDR